MNDAPLFSVYSQKRKPSATVEMNDLLIIIIQELSYRRTPSMQSRLPFHASACNHIRRPVLLRGPLGVITVLESFINITLRFPSFAIPSTIKITRQTQTVRYLARHPLSRTRHMVLVAQRSYLVAWWQ